MSSQVVVQMESKQKTEEKKVAEPEKPKDVVLTALDDDAKVGIPIVRQITRLEENKKPGLKSMLCAFYINKLEEFNSKDQVATVDFTFITWWYEPDLNQRMWKDWDGYVDLYKANIQIDEGREMEEVGDTSEWPWAQYNEAPWQIIQQQTRWRGQIHAPLDLRDFPYDHQTLTITCRSFAWPSTECQLINICSPEKMKEMADRIDLVDWDVAGPITCVEKNASFDPYRNLEAAGVQIQIPLKRKTYYYTAKVLSILTMLVLMSFAAFIVPPDIVQDRAQIIYTLFLSAVAFHFVVGESLPPVSYITTLDSYILLVYTMLALAALQTVISFVIQRDVDKDDAVWFDAWSCVAFGVFFLCCAGTLCCKGRKGQAKKLTAIEQRQKAVQEKANSVSLAKDEYTDMPSVMKRLKDDKDVTWLSIHALLAKKNEIEELAKELAITKQPLKKLDFTKNLMGDDTVIGLMKSLGSNPIYRTQLTHLHLMTNNVQDRGAIAIAEAFGLNDEMEAKGVPKCALYSLNLMYNFVRDDGAEALTSMLLAKDRSPIEYLNLGVNNLADRGTIAVANALKTNTVCKVINLGFNETADAGMLAMIDSLENHNSTLEKFYICDCKYPETLDTKLKKVMAGRGDGGSKGDDGGDNSSSKDNKNAAPPVAVAGSDKGDDKAVAAHHGHKKQQLNVGLEGDGKAAFGMIMASETQTLASARDLMDKELAGVQGMPSPGKYLFLSGAVPVQPGQEKHVPAVHAAGLNGGVLRLRAV